MGSSIPNQDALQLATAYRGWGGGGQFTPWSLTGKAAQTSGWGRAQQMANTKLAQWDAVDLFSSQIAFSGYFKTYRSFVFMFYDVCVFLVPFLFLSFLF